MIKGIYAKHSHILALLLVLVVGAPLLPARAAGNTGGDLIALERRAIQAKSLLEEVEKLKGQLAESRKKQLETEARVTALELSEQKKAEQIATLEADLAKANQLLEMREKLILLFRSGAFEYYEVQTGDTLESIAANPMVYGDKTKATLIGLVNDIKATSLPAPGAVLIIPRFTGGANYEF